MSSRIAIIWRAESTKPSRRCWPASGRCFEHCDNCGSLVYDAGTLVIDLVDARSSRLVWRGWAEKVDAVIENQDWMEETIDRVVAQILKKLPPRAA